MRRTMQTVSDGGSLAEQIQQIRPGIDQFVSTAESDVTPSPPPTPMSSRYSWQPIDDGVDEAAFEHSIRDLAASIHEEMRAYGDADEDANDLKLVEFGIQSERIARLVDGCVENVQFGFVLPLMLSDLSNAAVMEVADRMEPEDRNCIVELSKEFAMNVHLFAVVRHHILD